MVAKRAFVSACRLDRHAQRRMVAHPPQAVEKSIIFYLTGIVKGLSLLNVRFADFKDTCLEIRSYPIFAEQILTKICAVSGFRKAKTSGA